MSESEVSAIIGQLRELHAKIDNLTDLFHHARSEGWPRCAKQEERIKHLEGSIELAHVRISGIKKWLIASLVSVASALANYAWSILQSSIKH